MQKQIEIKLTAKEVAEQIWNLGSDEQAVMFEELLKVACSEHNLMMQFLYVRDECAVLEKSGRPESMAAFQLMFASAYKYFGE